MEYRNCNICQEPQEVTSEALRAWDDMILVPSGIVIFDNTYPCLCTDCYWKLKGD
jgi:hypothetical protein